MLKSKNPCGFVTETFKTGITNPQGFFDLSNFYIIKLISEPLTLRPLCCSRLRSNEKCLVDQLLLGQNLLKNVFNSKTFLNWRPLPSIKYSSFSNGPPKLVAKNELQSSLIDHRVKMLFSAMKTWPLCRPGNILWVGPFIG